MHKSLKSKLAEALLNTLFYLYMILSVLALFFFSDVCEKHSRAAIYLFGFSFAKLVVIFLLHSLINVSLAFILFKLCYFYQYKRINEIIMIVLKYFY